MNPGTGEGGDESLNWRRMKLILELDKDKMYPEMNPETREGRNPQR